jgi:CMP-N-acetylneuraminic acid synthetase
LNDCIALICARGGSKGLPGKNIRMLNGKPLIGWAIDLAKSLTQVRRILVSTDSEEIAEISRKFGADVPFQRPKELADDNSSEWLVWRHALDFIKSEEGKYPDSLLVLPVTAPLRSKEDVEECLDVFNKKKPDIVVTVTDAHRSPYFNMIKKNEQGFAELVIQNDKKVFRRQDAPIVYDMTTVAYVSRPDFIMNSPGIFDGKVFPVCIPQERAVDIDSLRDFEYAEFLLGQTD